MGKLYDRLLELEGRKDEQLEHIRLFLEANPTSDWALRRSALLKMDLDKVFSYEFPASFF